MENLSPEKNYFPDIRTPMELPKIKKSFEAPVFHHDIDHDCNECYLPENVTSTPVKSNRVNRENLDKENIINESLEPIKTEGVHITFNKHVTSNTDTRSNESKPLCPICLKKYSNRSNLINHMKTVHCLTITDIQKLAPPKTRPRASFSNQSIKRSPNSESVFIRACSSSNDAHLTNILKKLIEKKRENSPIKHQQLSCPLCHKFYSGRANLRSHLKFVHKKNVEERKSLLPYLIARKQKMIGKSNPWFDCYDTNANNDKKRQKPIVANIIAKRLKNEIPDENQNHTNIKNEVPEVKIEYCQETDPHSISTPDSTKFSKRGRPRDILTPKTSNFRCDMCDKNFSQQSGLWAHMKSIHEKRRFQCMYCPNNFGWQSSLSAHLKKVHKNIHMSSSCSETAKF